LQEYAEAAQYNSALSAPHLEAAKILFKLGRDAGGVAEFQNAGRLDPLNYQTLATIAHHLAASDNPQIRDGKIALLLAGKANELSGNRQPVVLDILGMAFAETGDFTNAITCAQNALALAALVQSNTADQIRARLDLYRKNQPWRESFRAPTSPPSATPPDTHAPWPATQ
jgi:tetratricopeptide (TPR) repeat protein